VFHLRLATTKFMVTALSVGMWKLCFCIENFLYVQVHRSREGGIFKSRLMAMRSELLKSPYLVELGALHLNLANARDHTMSVSELVGEFSCDFESSSPTLTCTLVDSATLDYDLSCAICLVLTVGFFFHFPCAEICEFHRFRFT